MYLLHIFLSSMALYKIIMKCVNAAFQEEIEKYKIEDILSLFDYSVTKSLIRLAGKNAAHFLYELFRDNKYLTMKENMN